MKNWNWKVLVPHAIAVAIFVVVALLYCKPALEGKVLQHRPFGIFVRLDSEFMGLIEIIQFKERGERMTPDEYPALGESTRAVVMGFKESGHQVWLSKRPSDLAKAEKTNRINSPKENE